MKIAITCAALALIAPAFVGEAHAQSSVDQCVELALKHGDYTKVTCIEAAARAPGPGVGGGRKTDRKTACLEATKQHPILGSPTVTRLECIAGRCNAEEVKLTTTDELTTKACLTVSAWSDSKSFGGGGLARFTLCADVKRNPTPADIVSLVKECGGG